MPEITGQPSLSSNLYLEHEQKKKAATDTTISAAFLKNFAKIFSANSTDVIASAAQHLVDSTEASQIDQASKNILSSSLAQKNGLTKEIPPDPLSDSIKTRFKAFLNSLNPEIKKTIMHLRSTGVIDPKMSVQDQIDAIQQYILAQYIQEKRKLKEATATISTDKTRKNTAKSDAIAKPKSEGTLNANSFNDLFAEAEELDATEIQNTAQPVTSSSYRPRDNTIFSNQEKLSVKINQYHANDGTKNVDVRNFLDPKNEAVQNTVNALYQKGILNGTMSAGEKAVAIQNYITQNLSYQKDTAGAAWKYAGQTLADGGGDCEDLVNLAGSMLLAAGVPADSINIYVKLGTKDEQGHVVLGLTEASGQEYVFDVASLLSGQQIVTSVNSLPLSNSLAFDFSYNSKSIQASATFGIQGSVVLEDAKSLNSFYTADIAPFLSSCDKVQEFDKDKDLSWKDIYSKGSVVVQKQVRKTLKGDTESDVATGVYQIMDGKTKLYEGKDVNSKISYLHDFGIVDGKHYVVLNNEDDNVQIIRKNAFEDRGTLESAAQAYVDSKIVAFTNVQTSREWIFDIDQDKSIYDGTISDRKYLPQAFEKVDSFWDHSILTFNSSDDPNQRLYQVANSVTGDLELQSDPIKALEDQGNDSDLNSEIVASKLLASAMTEAKDWLSGSLNSSESEGGYLTRLANFTKEEISSITKSLNLDKKATKLREWASDQLDFYMETYGFKSVDAQLKEKFDAMLTKIQQKYQIAIPSNVTIKYQASGGAPGAMGAYNNVLGSLTLLPSFANAGEVHWDPKWRVRSDGEINSIEGAPIPSLESAKALLAAQQANKTIENLMVLEYHIKSIEDSIAEGQLKAAAILYHESIHTQDANNLGFWSYTTQSKRETEEKAYSAADTFVKNEGATREFRINLLSGYWVDIYRILD